MEEELENLWECMEEALHSGLKESGKVFSINNIATI